MKIYKIFAVAMAAAVAMSMAGCGSGSTGAAAADDGASAAETAEETTQAETPAETPAQTTAEQDGQNPIMNYIGAYSDEGGKGYSLLLEPTDDTDGVFVTVGHPDGENYDVWEMYGKIKDNVITYTGAVSYRISPDASAETGFAQNVNYEDGTGSLEISQDNKITWKDDKENAGEGLSFVWNQQLNDEMSSMAEGNQDDAAKEVAALAAMNWDGPYADTNDENLTMEIIVEEGSPECGFTVTKKGDGSNAVMWTMSGDFDITKMTVSYTNCVKKDVQLDELGNVVSESIVYEDGTGSFVFDEENQTIEWKDDKEDAGKGAVFTFNFSQNTGGEGIEDEIEGEVFEDQMDEITQEQ